MAIKLNNKKNILDRTAIDNYLKKFNERVAEVDDNIAKLTAEIEKASDERRELMYKDMITAGDEFRNPLNNIITKIENYKVMLAVENEKKDQFIHIIQNPELERLLQDYYDNSFIEISEYINEDEREIYTELAELRDKILELTDKLNEKRRAIENEIYDFSALAQQLGYQKFKRSVGFHDNPRRPNPSFEELGAIIFNATSIKGFRYQYEMSKRVY